MSLPFTALDALVVLVIAVSAGYAAWRGFLSETLTIFAWLAAAFGCLYFGPYLIPMARDYFTTPWVASLVAYAVVFLAIFIPLSFMSHRFSESVKNSAVGPLDRALGIAFGVVRGLVLVGLAYLAFTYFVPIREQPRWLTEARVLPMVQSTGDVLLSLVPVQSQGAFAINRPAASSDDAIGNLIRDNEDANRVAPAQAGSDNYRERPENSPSESASKDTKKGYGATDRRALDTLFERAGNGGTR